MGLNKYDEIIGNLACNQFYEKVQDTLATYF